MSIIPLDVQRRCERRWAARFSRPQTVAPRNPRLERESRQIAVPNKLTSEQKEKLQDFAKALGENNSPLHESFFAKAKKFFQ